MFSNVVIFFHSFFLGFPSFFELFLKRFLCFRFVFWCRDRRSVVGYRPLHLRLLPPHPAARGRALRIGYQEVREGLQAPSQSTARRRLVECTRGCGSASRRQNYLYKKRVRDLGGLGTAATPVGPGLGPGRGHERPTRPGRPRSPRAGQRPLRGAKSCQSG